MQRTTARRWCAARATLGPTDSFPWRSRQDRAKNGERSGRGRSAHERRGERLRAAPARCAGSWSPSAVRPADVAPDLVLPPRAGLARMRVGGAREPAQRPVVGTRSPHRRAVRRRPRRPDRRRAAGYRLASRPRALGSRNRTERRVAHHRPALHVAGAIAATGEPDRRLPPAFMRREPAQGTASPSIKVKTSMDQPMMGAPPRSQGRRRRPPALAASEVSEDGARDQSSCVRYRRTPGPSARCPSASGLPERSRRPAMPRRPARSGTTVVDRCGDSRFSQPAPRADEPCRTAASRAAPSST